jgi:putative ABC transport system substrate-binding protein
MRRREFITLLGGAATAWPVMARGQPAKKLWRIGCIVGGSSQSAGLDGIPKGLRELGHVEGKDSSIEWRLRRGEIRTHCGFRRQAD